MTGLDADLATLLARAEHWETRSRTAEAALRDKDAELARLTQERDALRERIDQWERTMRDRASRLLSGDSACRPSDGWHYFEVGLRACRCGALLDEDGAA